MKNEWYYYVQMFRKSSYKYHSVCKMYVKLLEENDTGHRKGPDHGFTNSSTTGTLHMYIICKTMWWR